MAVRFEYGVTRVKDLAVETVDVKGAPQVRSLLINGMAVRPSQRFWTSFQMRFGFTANVFKYFRHGEVFNRISEVAKNDQIRWCVERHSDGTGTALAITNPQSGLIRHDDLRGLLEHYDAGDISYSKGVVRSTHTPRFGGTFDVAGDAFQNRFVIDTPVDGFGRPSVYLSLLRLVCSNGAVGYGRAFRSELNVGKGEEGVGYALVRVLDGFNNEEGYAAMRQRFESAARSWASVREVSKLYKVLVRLHNWGEVRANASPRVGGDGASEVPSGSPLLRSFEKMTGDLTRIYGLANLDALSVKRQRTLPAACKVYDLLNYASEVATHHAADQGGRSLQAYIGDLITGEYDLEGTAEQFSDYQDFFVGSASTTETLAGMNQR